jgi:ribonuclease HII
MRDLARAHPGYGWERNAGYGTAQHLAALRRLGATAQHRKSFAPVAEALGISR